MNGHVHLVVPGLFLAHGMAAEPCGESDLRALETVLARADAHALHAESLEAWLGEAFGTGDALAPVTLAADGGQPGAAYWLRADPAYLMLRGSDVILRPLVAVRADEAAQLCDTLNRHFAAEGLHFSAPHPQRWYLRLAQAPDIATHPLARVAGRDIRDCLPHGPDALRWHRMLNEIQMLLHAHPVNDAREARGEAPVNSVWLWGGGYGHELAAPPFARVYADSALAAAFAAAAHVSARPLAGLAAQGAVAGTGTTLVVWDGLGRAAGAGDVAAWCESLGALERACMAPLLHALRQRTLERLTLDAVQEHGAWRYTLTPRTAWRFWRRRRRLGQYPAASR